MGYQGIDRQSEFGLPKPLLKRIRDLVRKWYGAISVNELTKNSKLVAEIAAFENWMAQAVTP